MSTLNAKLNVKGADKLIGQLENVRAKVQKKALRKIVNDVTKVGLAVAKSRCPKGQGTNALFKSLGRRVRVKKQKTVAIIGRVFPRKGFETIDANGEKHDPRRIAHIIEYGRKALTPTEAEAIRFTVGGQIIFTKRIKAVPAHPFMRPALDECNSITPATAEKAIAEVLKP